MSTIKSSAENLTLNADGANNDIKFQSNGSEVASIDQAGTITATNFTGTGGNLTVKSDGTTPAIILRDSDNNIDGMFKALNGTVGMQVTGGEWALLATTNAEISLYHDNAVKLATSALGVTVTGGVSLGGTAAANTLDDYEEGTWSPAIAVGSGISMGTIHAANYTKIGNTCTLSTSVEIASSNVPASGDVRISGFPFSFKSFGEGAYPVVLHYTYRQTPNLYMDANGYMYYQNTNVGGNNVESIGAALDALNYLAITFTYITT